MHKDYVLPNVMITENGAAFKDQLINGKVDDISRVRYFHDHISATYAAIEQGVPVTGYFAWSLMDNFEWASGFEKRFGLVYVDYATQKRTLKNSALWYQKFLSGK
jgi:beta-glucosidase